MNSKPQFLWYNFRTGQYDARDEPPDGDEWRDYISQIPAAQAANIGCIIGGGGALLAVLAVVAAALLAVLLLALEAIP